MHVVTFMCALLRRIIDPRREQGITGREVLKLLYKDGWKESEGRLKAPIFN
jgi:hypothetical protein